METVETVIAERTNTPNGYYTSRYSGEEIDRKLDIMVSPNLLDNAYFVGGGTGWGVFPVNQRGQRQYSSVGPIYDRWKINTGDSTNVELAESGVTITGGTPYTGIFQVLKKPLTAGSIYTVSVLFSDGTFVSKSITAAQSEGSDILQLTSAGSYVRFSGNSAFNIVVLGGDTVPAIAEMKVEPGDTQTLAYKKSDGTWTRLQQNLDYQAELSKCQAYLWVPQKHSAFTMLGVGHALNETTAYATVVPPVAMRTGGAPVVNISNPSDICMRGTSVVYASAVSVEGNSDGTPIVLNVTGAFTPGDVFDVFLSNSGSIEFSREL